MDVRQPYKPQYKFVDQRDLADGSIDLNSYAQ